jgi:hypothetical protein
MDHAIKRIEQTAPAFLAARRRQAAACWCAKAQGAERTMADFRENPAHATRFNSYNNLADLE